MKTLGMRRFIVFMGIIFLANCSNQKEADQSTLTTNASQEKIASILSEGEPVKTVEKTKTISRISSRPNSWPDTLVFENSYSGTSNFQFKFTTNPVEGWSSILDINSDELLCAVGRTHSGYSVIQLINLKSFHIEYYQDERQSVSIVGGSLKENMIYLESDSALTVRSLDSMLLIESYSIPDVRSVQYINETTTVITKNEGWENSILSTMKRIANGIPLQQPAPSNLVYTYDQPDWAGQIQVYNIKQDTTIVLIPDLPLDGVYAVINDSLLIVTQDLSNEYPTTLLNINSKQYLNLYELLNMDMFKGACTYVAASDSGNLIFVECSGRIAIVALGDLLKRSEWKKTELKIGQLAF